MTVYNEDISNYITELFAQEDEDLSFIRHNSHREGLPEINISPEEARFLQLLVRIARTRLALEIGTLGGYSGTWIARGLQPGGRLITIEKSQRHVEVARQHFVRAGVQEQVDLRQGDAHQLLPALAKLAPYDFVFIDADKVGYSTYFEWAVQNVRPGGVICAHNALWGGSVVGEYEGEAVNYAREFNQLAAGHPQVSSSIYPAGDGLLVAVRH